jgi:hypothetical protein
LRYLSVDPKELKLVTEKLAQLTNKPIDSIEVFPLEDSSKIVLHGIIDTWEKLDDKLFEYQKQLRKEGDDRIELYRKIEVGDSRCPAELLDLESKTKIIIYNIIDARKIIDNSINMNNNNGDNVTMNIETKETKKEKKKSRNTAEDFAKQWIESHPYVSTLTRGDYYNKYTRKMEKDTRSYISIKQFAVIMRAFGYREGRSGHGGTRIWEKDEDSDEED